MKSCFQITIAFIPKTISNSWIIYHYQHILYALIIYECVQF